MKNLHLLSQLHCLHCLPLPLRVEQPGVPPGALLAGPQPDGLTPRQLGRGQGALVRQRADGLALDLAAVLPLLEGRDVDVAHRVGHPQQRLEVGHEVDVLVSGQGLVHPVLELLHEALVGVEPEGGEGEGEGRPVGAVVPREVVLQQRAELLRVLEAFRAS